MDRPFPGTAHSGHGCTRERRCGDERRAGHSALDVTAASGVRAGAARTPLSCARRRPAAPGGRAAAWRGRRSRLRESDSLPRDFRDTLSLSRQGQTGTAEDCRFGGSEGARVRGVGRDRLEARRTSAGPAPRLQAVTPDPAEATVC
ncbi:hypothetical protein GCM10017714_10090 [Curtobacterium pusillum]